VNWYSLINIFKQLKKEQEENKNIDIMKLNQKDNKRNQKENKFSKKSKDNSNNNICSQKYTEPYIKKNKILLKAESMKKIYSNYKNIKEKVIGNDTLFSTNINEIRELSKNLFNKRDVSCQGFSKGEENLNKIKNEKENKAKKISISKEKESTLTENNNYIFNLKFYNMFNDIKNINANTEQNCNKNKIDFHNGIYNKKNITKKRIILEEDYIVGEKINKDDKRKSRSNCGKRIFSSPLDNRKTKNIISDKNYKNEVFYSPKIIIDNYYHKNFDSHQSYSKIHNLNLKFMNCYKKNDNIDDNLNCRHKKKFP
jgi:hypothetical protein